MSKDATPYPGLRPYREDEYYKFFGRQADAEILIDKLLTNRLTLLFAASGVGKSSLLQAAVIPKLKAAEGENLSVAYHNDWISPSTQNVKLSVLTALQTSKIIARDADFSDDSLLDILRFSSALVRPPFVLILDQFEEFFRYQRASPEFPAFIDQLVALITSTQLALSLVISMREDFALELNAFKPKLPTILFENFYRLEKLGRDTALVAIETPIKQLGFNYEPELLKVLTQDLLSRELDRNPNLPITELRMTVEPPYLQIVCAHLWELNKQNPDKLLHLASYEKAGRAQGILKSYIKHVLDGFNHTEKQLASQAFDHLVSQHGVKMAYTAPALAKTLRIKPTELQAVLEKLEKVRILRKQQREEETWYELYHDMFSTSLDSWNSAWKDRVRSKRNFKILLGSLLSVCLIISGIDIYVNSQFYHLRLSAKQDSDRVELWQGMTNESLWPFDLFRQRQYLAETHLTRDNLEPDKRFSQKNIYRYHDLQAQLTADRPIEERITGLAENGDYPAAIQLAKDTITPSNIELAKRAIPHLNTIHTETAVKILYSTLRNSSSDIIKNAIADEATQGSIGIILLKEGINSVQLEPPIDEITLPKAEDTFWENQLSFQAIRLDTLDKWLSWNVYDLEKLLSTPYTEKINNYINNLIENDSSNSLALKTAVDLNLPNIKLHLLNLLKIEKNSSNKALIINHLVKLKAVEIILPLIKSLKNKDHETRKAALYGLALLEDQKTIPEFINLLKDENPSIRGLAVDALTRLKAQIAIPNLIQLLKDEDSYVRGTAVVALGSLKAQIAIPNLIQQLKDEDSYVRILTIETIGELNQITINKTSIFELIKLLKDKDNAVRSTTIRTLGLLKIQTINLELKQLLKDEDSSIRSAAIYVLSQLENKITIPELINLLKDKSDDVRITTIKALYSLQAQAAIPELINLLKDESDDVRITTIEALYSLQAQAAIPELINLLKDENYSIRKATIKTLELLKIQITIPESIKLKNIPENTYEKIKINNFYFFI